MCNVSNTKTSIAGISQACGEETWGLDGMLTAARRCCCYSCLRRRVIIRVRSAHAGRKSAEAYSEASEAVG